LVTSHKKGLRFERPSIFKELLPATAQRFTNGFAPLFSCQGIPKSKWKNIMNIITRRFIGSARKKKP
jgi:hypothetical protein